MARVLVAGLLATLLAPTARAVAGSAVLTPQELATRLDDPELRIVDIRGGREANGRAPFDNGHIRGAQSAPYASWRGPKHDPGQLLPEDQVGQLIEQLGIEADSRVVVVFEGSDPTDFGAAARVAWTLKAGGVARVAILNGGMAAWRRAGLPVTEAVAEVMPSAFSYRLDPRRVTTRDELAAAIGSSAGKAGSWRLLDARPPAFHAGAERHPLARAPGTLPGSENLDSALWFRPGTAELADEDTLRRIAREHGLDDRRPVVSFCNSGHWAATNWFVLQEVLGHPEVRLYPASMIDWSRAGLPMDNHPGRLQQFAHQLRAALAP